MCNFIIRPIKSYATVDISLEAGENNDISQIERGDAVQVSHVVPEGVVVRKDDKTTHVVPLSVFVHVFTANPDDIDKVRKEEHKIMGYNPNKKKETDK